jgi:hypothetical protein
VPRDKFFLAGSSGNVSPGMALIHAKPACAARFDGEDETLMMWRPVQLDGLGARP